MSLRLDTGSQSWLPLCSSFVNDTLLQLCPHNDETLVVIRGQAPAQTKESARSADKRPSPRYCVAICFYYAALGHMFVLVGCWRGARPYVSIMRRWAICL